MNSPDSASNDSLRLKRLLKAAGLRSYRLDPKRRMVNFICRTREWALAVSLDADWVNVTTLICELPKQAGIRARLLEWAMESNRASRLVKYGIGDNALRLELDYRSEHVDHAVLGNLIGLVSTLAEAQYARAFRIVNGDDVLESLGRTLETEAAS